MAFVTWVPNADGNWDTASDWSGGVLPTAADTVVISTSTEHTVTLSQGNVTIASLSVGNDILDLDDLNGGSLTVDGAVSMASGFIQQAGSLFTTGTVSVTGTAQLLGGLLGGNAVFEATGLVTLANYTLSGNAQLINSNMVDETGSITLSSGSTATAIVNEAAGTFDIATGVAINNGSTPVSDFSNAGTLEMTATNNVTSHIYVDLTSTGLVTAIAGSSLEVDGPSNNISGTIAGTGQVSFGGGNTTIASGTSISVGTLGIYNNGTNVIFAGAETLTGSISLSGGSTLTLDGDTTASGLSDIGAADILLGMHTLTIQGSASFEQSNGSPLIAGTGKLVTLGTTTLINNGGPALILGGSVGWNNSGTVVQTQSLQIGTASGSAATVTNQASGVFDMTLGGISISNGSSPVSKFSNAGTLEMTATGNVTSYIGADLGSTGLITAVAGSNLEIDGPLNTISGTIAGTGQISFGSGSTTIASNTAITVGTLSAYGTGTNLAFASTQALAGNLSVGGSSTLTLNGNTTVAGTFSDVGATSILLGSHTLTLKGSAFFQQYYGTPFIAGSGKLVTMGTTTLNGGGSALMLGGSIAWDNAGIVMDGQSIQVGTNSGSAASVVNQAHDVFDITASGIVISNGSSPVSTFSNAGTLEMTATNNGTSYVQADLVSTGIISAVAGSNLEIDGPINTLSGTITGTGQVLFGGGTTTLAGGMTLNVASLTLHIPGTDLVLGGNETISGAFTESGPATLSLAGHTLTLAGAATFGENYGATYVAGAGRLVTKGTTSLVGGNTAMILGSTATWENAGVVNASRGVQLGNNASSSASLVNDAKAVFDIVASGVVLSNGSMPASTFSNAGTLEMTATNNQTSYIQADLVSTGVISAVAGSNLEIDGPVNTISGTITGTGQVLLGGGTTTIAGSTAINVANLELHIAGTDLILGGNETVTGGFGDSGPTTLSLAGYTLTLASVAAFGENYGATYVSGSGTLLTQGTTTLNGGNTAMILGSTATWENAGVVNASRGVQLGNNTSSSASLVNDAKAVFDIVASGVALSNGSTPVSTFSNAGTLEMTATNNATSYVQSDLVSTGIISAVAGSNLEIDGPVNTLSGTIMGTGQVSFGGGTNTIAGNTTISVGTLEVYNTGTILTFGGAETIGGNFTLAANSAVVTLGGNTTIDGSYAQYYGSTLSLGAYSLTLDGNALFQNGNTPTVTGTGTLVTIGTTTLVNNAALVLGGSATWDNTGTVVQDGSFQLGNASTATTLVNQAAGVFDLAGYVAVNNGSTAASIFSNAGTLEMTGSNTTGYVRVDLLSTGTVSTIAGSNLEIDGPANTISGTITGAGQVSFGGGTTTIAGGTSISAGTLALYTAGSNVKIGGNVTVSGAFNDSNATTISLAGHTLTLAAAAAFNQYYGTPLIAGQGTLVTRGATTVGGGSTGLVLGGTATWNNFGMVTDSQSMQFGDSTNGTATVNNEKGGVFDIVVNGVTLSNGNTLASTFTNAGLLEMTTGGNASLAANVTNTGTVLAQSGGLALSGAISGTGLLEVQSSGTLGFSGTVQSTETVKFLDTTGRLNVALPSASAFGAEITGFVAGDTIDLTNISNATGAFSAGVLTFTDNTSHAVVATLNFSNSPAFSFASDGHGGTLITTTTQARRAPGQVLQNPRFIGPISSETHAITEGQPRSLHDYIRTLSLADWVESAGQQTHLGFSTPAFASQDLAFGESTSGLAAHNRPVSTDATHIWNSLSGSHL